MASGVIGLRENTRPIIRDQINRLSGKASRTSQLLKTMAATMMPQKENSTVRVDAACAQAETNAKPPHEAHLAGKVLDALNLRHVPMVN